MQYITFRLQTDCNQTFHPLSFSIKYVLYFLYFLYFQSRQVERGAWSLARHRQFGFNHR